jgi:hypothetical protein
LDHDVVIASLLAYIVKLANAIAAFLVADRYLN